MEWVGVPLIAAVSSIGRQRPKSYFPGCGVLGFHAVWSLRDQPELGKTVYSFAVMLHLCSTAEVGVCNSAVPYTECSFSLGS